MKRDHQDSRRQWRCACRSVARGVGLGMVAVLLAAPVKAQPSAEGAVSTLEDKPKNSSSGPFATVCALTADDLATAGDCVQLPICTEPQPCEVEGGLDHVAAGVGLRNRLSGTIDLSGAPPGAVAVAAWLYWGLIMDDPGTGEENPAAIVFDGHPLIGELVDTAPEPCWGAPPDESTALFRAYRKPVWDYLHPGINGDYRVEVPSTQVSDGRDPWHGSAAQPWVEGVSLVVLYAHPDVPRGARFYLHEGPALLIGDLEVAHPLPALYPTTQVGSVLRHTRLGGGGQRRAGHRPTYPFSSDLAWIPASCADVPATRLAGPGSEIDPVSDWKGADGGPITQLWDTQVTEVLWTRDIEECTDYRITYGTPAGGMGDDSFVYDCVVVVAHALTVR